MAKKPTSTKIARGYVEKSKVSRPGVHAKTKSSNHKHSKCYVKKSRGQG